MNKEQDNVRLAVMERNKVVIGKNKNITDATKGTKTS